MPHLMENQTFRRSSVKKLLMLLCRGTQFHVGCGSVFKSKTMASAAGFQFPSPTSAMSGKWDHGVSVSNPCVVLLGPPLLEAMLPTPEASRSAMKLPSLLLNFMVSQPQFSSVWVVPVGSLPMLSIPPDFVGLNMKERKGS